MKRNSTVILILLAVFLLLVGLNFLFMVDERENEETEQNGSRSSYRSTPFGTMAYYNLLEQSGYPVTRFEKPFTKLKERTDLHTLLLIAPPPTAGFDEAEFKAISAWVEQGNLLIIIDREIYVPLGDAQISTSSQSGEAQVHPLQPTLYAEGIENLKLTKYASRVSVDSKATTYLYGDSKGAVLADASIGKGRVLCLTEPFIVANNGIAEADNFVLAVNLLLNAPAGSIAFDEYHHGYGSGGAEGAMAYFSGKPVKWIFWQVVLIAALVVYSYGRRFARPVPLKRESRTTNLEFVSSMANITRLAKASDLAMQNIYSDFRNKLCRYSGLPSRVDSPRLAATAAHRMQRDERELRDLLAKCENVMHGSDTSDAELLKLVTRIREIEAEIRA
ncbi:MAG: DUF4350 domain-containing protein [Acidobacteria bacterium]|nr:DUF4350 domain-containing protein [Acidobacteriota bacterium]